MPSGNQSTFIVLTWQQVIFLALPVFRRISFFFNVFEMRKLSVVLPVYNEETVLEKNVGKITSFLSQNFGDDYIVIISDNGSTDRTFKKAQELASRLPNVSCIHLDEKGRGCALKKAWSVTDSGIVSYMDIDLSTGLESFPLLIKNLEEGADIAIGSRFSPGAAVDRSFLRGVLSAGYNKFIQVFLGASFHDAQCGFKAMKKAVFDSLVDEVKNNEWFFDTEFLYRAQRRGYRINEVPVKWSENPDSKVDIVSTVIDYLFLILKLRFE
jgi:glycosyltransferase involved in cell wall biosynthesis